MSMPFSTPCRIGIGPKVAACVALFSLDKHEAIPVDTHVWQVCVDVWGLHWQMAGRRRVEV